MEIKLSMWKEIYFLRKPASPLDVAGGRGSMLEGDTYTDGSYLRFRLRLPAGSNLRLRWNKGNNSLKQAPIIEDWRPSHLHLARGADVLTETGRRQVGISFSDR